MTLEKKKKTEQENTKRKSNSSLKFNVISVLTESEYEIVITIVEHDVDISNYSAIIMITAS